MMAPAPRSVDSLLGVKLLTGVLSLTAGSTV
jgi:hypothetical protein